MPSPCTQCNLGDKKPHIFLLCLDQIQNVLVCVCSPLAINVILVIKKTSINISLQESYLGISSPKGTNSTIFSNMVYKGGEQNLYLKKESSSRLVEPQYPQSAEICEVKRIRETLLVSCMYMVPQFIYSSNEIVHRILKPFSHLLVWCMGSISPPEVTHEYLHVLRQSQPQVNTLATFGK